MKTVRILGAGLSGLSAAINLSLNGVKVEVLERRSSVGGQISPNFQVMHSGGRTPGEYLSSLNLKPSFRQIPLQKAYFSTSSRDLDLNLKQEVFFIQRGGQDSLEYGLYRQALSLGVEFKFNQNASDSEVDIVACGPKMIDAVAYGEVYETDSFPGDHFFMMYDDRYSPRGWYLYAVPYGSKLAVVNCACQPHVGRAKELLHRALLDKTVLKEAVGNRKPVGFVGGFGNAWIPKTAVRDGRLYTGEAAGFQDPFRGFGMKFALESGWMAADAIVKKLDYDRLWKKQFMPQFKLDYSRRLFLSIFGSRIVDLAYRNVKSGSTIDFVRGDVQGTVGGFLKSVFLNLEVAKRCLTGRW